MFSRYTERAQRVVVLAQDEARKLQSDHVGVEHLLLGLLREQESTAARALASIGLKVDPVRAAVAKILGPGPGAVSGEISFSPGAKKVMVEAAIDEARLLGHNYVGTEHLLLGLLRDGQMLGLLYELGANPEALRTQIRHLLGQAPGEMAPQLPVSLYLLPLAHEVSHVLLPLATSEAQRAGAAAIAPEHLLLAMLRDGAPSPVANLLLEKGVTLAWARQRLQQGRG